MWGASAERSCLSVNKNRIDGGAKQGERFMNREALVIKVMRRRSGGCAAKECVLNRGDLALWVKARRPMPEREVSRGRRIGGGPGPGPGPMKLQATPEVPNESE